jgi:hypothetical protein
MEKFMLPCLFKTLFGFECLGCGFQRSVFLLFQGHFLEALKMYPAVYTSLLFLVIGVFYYFNQSKNNKKILLISGFVNIIFMLVGYYFKHFYL